MVAHWHFEDAISSQRAFEDHLNRPAVCHLLKSEPAYYVRAAGAKRAEIGDLQPIYKINQASGETIPECLMPGQCAGRTPIVQARTEHDVRAAFGDWRQHQ